MDVNVDRLYSEDTAQYLYTADRRIVSGFRFALELQGLVLPAAAVIKPSGPRRRVDVLRDYHADNPVEATRDRQRTLESGFAASRTNRNLRNTNV